MAEIFDLFSKMPVGMIAIIVFLATILSIRMIDRIVDLQGKLRKQVNGNGNGSNTKVLEYRIETIEKEIEKQTDIISMLTERLIRVEMKLENIENLMNTIIKGK